MKRFLNRLFSKSTRPSKIEFWKKFEFFELLDDLHKAEVFLANYTEGHSGEFTSVESFREALAEAIYDFNDNNPDLTNIWRWFAPTCQWDDFTGKKGTELGNKIFERVDKWKKHNDKTR